MTVRRNILTPTECKQTAEVYCWQKYHQYNKTWLMAQETEISVEISSLLLTVPYLSTADASSIRHHQL